MTGDARMPAGEVRLGRYRLVERIGAGGMAEVFRATTQGAEGFVREVCIKRILPIFAGEGEFVRMFVHEAQVTARLQHANIAQVFDFAEHEGAHFLVMELVDGPDLRQLLHALAARHEAMPLEIALYVALEMLEALHYAHGRTEPDGRPLDLVHRDISPHNVLVSYAGEVKLTDFGIAKARTLGLRTKTGQIKGKLAYMAPEQALGRAVDARTDLWALGVVLFEMIAGERPFQASTDVELSSAIIGGRLPPLSRFRPQVPPPLERAVGRLLSADLSGRPQSASEALGLVRDAMRESGIPPASALDLAALVARVAPRSRGPSSVPPLRDPTELASGAAVRPPAPEYRVAGPSDPTATHRPHVDPFDPTAPGRASAIAGLGEVPPLRGSLTSIDAAPAGAVVLVPSAAPAAGPPMADPRAAPVSAAGPVPTVAGAPPAAALSPSAAGASGNAVAPAPAAPASTTWAAGTPREVARETSWTPLVPTPPPSQRPPAPRAAEPGARVPLTRRPACLVVAFVGFLLLGLFGGATAWYALRGRRLRRPGPRHSTVLAPTPACVAVLRAAAACRTAT